MYCTYSRDSVVWLQGVFFNNKRINSNIWLWVELECMYGTHIFLRSTVQRQRCSDESKNRPKKWGEGCSQVHHDMFCNVQDIVRWSLTNIKSSLVVRHILNTYHINCGFLSPERSRNNTRDKLRYLFWRVWYHRSYFFRTVVCFTEVWWPPDHEQPCCNIIHTPDCF